MADFRTAYRKPFRKGSIGSTRLARAILDQAVVLNDLPATFARASTAICPCTGREVAHNLCRYSQDMQGANWTKYVATIDGGANPDPNGTSTATLITATAGAGNHDVASSSITVVQGDQYTVSAYVKQGTAPKAMVGDRGDSVWHAVILDFATGVLSRQENATGTATNVGGGWYRVTCTFTKVSAVLSASVFVAPVNADVASPSYTAAGTETVLAWGGQLNRGPFVTDYVATTATAADGSNVRRRIPLTIGMRQVQGDLIEGSRQNLCTYSQKLDDSSWTGTTYADATAVVSAFPAPDGTMTAWDLTDNSAAVYQEKEKGITVANDGATYCISVYVRKTTAATSAFGINIALTGGTAVSNTPRLNTNTGTLGGYVNAGVDDAGAYWRVWCSITNNSSGNTTLKWYLFPAVKQLSGGGDTATATGTATLWGVQVEPGAFPSSYIPTTSAAVTRSADGLNVSLDSIIDDARSNRLLYSQAFDNAAWIKADASPVGDAAVAPDSTTTADTINYLYGNVAHYVSQTPAPVSGTHALSVYAKRASCDYLCVSPNAGGVGAMFNLVDGTITDTLGTVVGYTENAGNGWWRCVVVWTGTSGECAFILSKSPLISSYVFQGTGDNGVYLWGAQLELASAAGTYTPTTSAEVVRTTGLSRTAGTILTIAYPYGWTGDQDGSTAWTIHDESPSSNDAQLIRVSASGLYSRRADAAGANVSAPTHGLTNRTARVIAEVYDSTNNRTYVGGVANGYSTAPTLPFNAVNQMQIGALGNGSNPFYGYVAVLYWPRALTADEIRTLNLAVEDAPALAA